MTSPSSLPELLPGGSEEHTVCHTGQLPGAAAASPKRRHVLADAAKMLLFEALDGSRPGYVNTVRLQRAATVESFLLQAHDHAFTRELLFALGGALVGVALPGPETVGALVG